VKIPQDWDLFWENIRSDFKDVVVTDSEGELLTFGRKDGASFSTRTLTLQIDGLEIKNDDAMNVVYVYFNHPDETSDSADSVTITSPKIGYILLSSPHSRIVSSRSAQSSTDSPIQSFVKGTGEAIHIFFALSSSLARRISPYNERNDEEGIAYVTVHSYDDSGTDSIERYTESQTRLGAGFVRATYKGGTDGESYAVSVKFNTTLGQVIETRAILRVIDLLP